MLETMMKHSKRKCKSTTSDLESLLSGDEGVGQTRNPLAALDERLDDIERRNRGRRRRKPPTHQISCTSHRSNSVPSKTVSFSPYVLHRVENVVSCGKQPTCWGNTCARCRANNRKSAVTVSPCRKKMLAKRPMDQGRHKVTCMPGNSVYTQQDKETSVCGSPKPESYYWDFPCCDAKLKSHCCAASDKSFHSVEDDTIPLSGVSVSKLGRSYPYFNPTSLRCSRSAGSLHVSGNNSDDFSRSYRSPFLSSFPTVSCWRTDSKIDCLIAKYGDYHYTKSTSSLPYQNYSFELGWPFGNISHNKSPHSRADLYPSAYAGSSSLFRQPVTCSSTSGFTNLFKSLANRSESFPTSYGGSYVYPTFADTYQSSAMKSLNHDPLFQKDMLLSCSHSYYPMSSLACSLLDLDSGSHFDRRRSMWHGTRPTGLLSKYTSSLPVTASRLNFQGCKNLDSTDDMKIMSKSGNISCNASFLSRADAANVSVDNTYKPRSSPYIPSLTRYGDSNSLLSTKYNPYVQADSKRDSHRHTYSWNCNRSVMCDPVWIPKYYTTDVANGTSADSKSLANSSLRLHSDFSHLGPSSKNQGTNTRYRKTLDPECSRSMFKGIRSSPVLEGLSNFWHKQSPRLDISKLKEDGKDIFSKSNLASDDTVNLKSPRSRQSSAKVFSILN